MPNLNPRVIGDLPYPNRSATTNVDLAVGGILSITVLAAGTLYNPGDELTIVAPPSGGIQATAVVDTVGASGDILTVKVTNPGAGYTVAPTPTIFLPIGGVQATFNVAVISDIVPVFLGRIYSMNDATGKLAIPIAANDIADFTNGLFQARATTVIGDGFTKVQVVTPPTRILLRAESALFVGDKVQLDAPGNVVNQEKVVFGDNTFVEGHLGRIFEIETKNADGSKKSITEDNDLVVIDLGVSQ